MFYKLNKTAGFNYVPERIDLRTDDLFNDESPIPTTFGQATYYS